jgi:hypothetical protein
MEKHETEQEQSLDRMPGRVANYRMLALEEVALHFGVARSTVDQMPMEVLPFADLAPAGKRQLKRYHPSDVLAAPAYLRALRAAQQDGSVEKFLSRRREELEARDRLMIETAAGPREVAA